MVSAVLLSVCQLLMRSEMAVLGSFLYRLSALPGHRNATGAAGRTDLFAAFQTGERPSDDLWVGLYEVLG